MKKKKNRDTGRELNERFDDYERFELDDERYWGLFTENGKTVVDPERFLEMTGEDFSGEQLEIINNHQTRYFHPRKGSYSDYNIVYFYYTIDQLKDEWDTIYKPLIGREVARIEKEKEVTPGDDYNFMSGISSYNAAVARANFYNWQAERDYAYKCEYLLKSLYSQFFHQMMSKIEAVIVKVLTKNNAIKDRFDIGVFYGTTNKCDKKIDDLPSFKLFEKSRLIWNFIKHNSQSTYEPLKEKYSEVLVEAPFEQGNMGFCYVKFNDELIEGLIEGNRSFFDEYCELVYNETYSEAEWNYEEYFERIVRDKKDEYDNSLGLDMFDDID